MLRQTAGLTTNVSSVDGIHILLGRSSTSSACREYGPIVIRWKVDDPHGSKTFRLDNGTDGFRGHTHVGSRTTRQAGHGRLLTRQGMPVHDAEQTLRPEHGLCRTDKADLIGHPWNVLAIRT